MSALTGDDLTLQDVWAVAVERRPATDVSEEARERMLAARGVVERVAHGAHEHTYGVNTGFGRFVNEADSRGADGGAAAAPAAFARVRRRRRLPGRGRARRDAPAREHAREGKLGRAHRDGLTAARVPQPWRAAEVPARGSVGASGDLAPLAHLALPLVGEGHAWFDGELLDGAEALARAGLEPVRLLAKEGLSLINGTQFMTAQGALGLVRAHRLARAADCACALSLEALQGSRNSFLPQVHALRPLRGQAASARNVMRLLDGSAIIESHRWCDKVQDAYSLRCAPQVHGASRDLLDYVDYTITTELNSATDNPLVLADDELLVSAGNFHGQPLAFALDALAMAVSELASISERRLERLVNPNLSDGLPAFLTTDGGLNSGFMIPQYVAAALVSENKSLCHPASVDSIPTSAGQEDHVSMGNASGLKAWQVVANAERAVAIELLAGAQAVEFLAPLEPGRGVRALHDAVRERSLRLRDDRPLGRDIEAVAAAIRDGFAGRRSRVRGRGAGMTPPRRLRWGAPEPPAPKHPYRDTLLVYAGLAAIVVLIAWATGGGVVKAVVIAGAFFLVATGWTTYRLRQRALEEKARSGAARK